jgi:hypothetical protein
VGVVKRRVLRGLWRRLVGVGIIGTGLSGSGLYTVLGRAVSLSSPSRLARPSLCPVVRARDLGWCDHNYSRWDGHTLCHGL